MAWEVEYTEEFEWWGTLTVEEQTDVDAYVSQLIKRGPALPFPYTSDIRSSRHGPMRELRVQSGGKPLRIFYAFDPRRTAILLLGGDKTGDPRFYEQMVPLADRLYDEHLAEIQNEIKEEHDGHGRKAPIFRTARPDVSAGAKAGRRKGPKTR
ncbi:MAG TPA: type II toxin-antitoxin system RelE/ParE family toxin [Candidatus Binataceae bacterium]|nr:type II toxin-antitoxin system RelE/ParE family toxin [Candidatus Binataceae bacterium]